MSLAGQKGRLKVEWSLLILRELSNKSFLKKTLKHGALDILFRRSKLNSPLLVGLFAETIHFLTVWLIMLLRILHFLILTYILILPISPLFHLLITIELLRI